MAINFDNDGNPINVKFDESGTPYSAPNSFWENIKEKAGNIGETIAQHGFGAGVGGGNPDIPKKEYYGKGLGEYAPSIVAAGATSLLAPEVALPYYALAGAASQGTTKGLMNLAEGKPFLNKDVAKETLLGGLGGGIQKGGAILGEKLLNKLALHYGGDSVVKELAQGLLNQSIGSPKEKLYASLLGPETIDTLENIMQGISETPGSSGKEADILTKKLTNLTTKGPKSVLTSNIDNADLVNLQQDLRDLLKLKVQPAENVGKTVLGGGANLTSQQVLPYTPEIIRDIINSITGKKEGK